MKDINKYIDETLNVILTGNEAGRMSERQPLLIGVRFKDIYKAGRYESAQDLVNALKKELECVPQLEHFNKLTLAERIAEGQKNKLAAI
ncbi:MAG: hypothetical protein MJ200_05990 [Mycoplasmoidaceae bacterium]|nr:hypothetical protein [Mycoplasmoidaceae bacterium]